MSARSAADGLSDGEVIRPFRWDVAKRSQLGSLPEVDLPETYQEFEDDLFACCARLLAFAGDSDLVFVGRSPHAIFDLLSGLLLDTTWTDRLQLLNVALRRTDPTREEVLALHPYLDAVGLAPRRLERRSRPIALADVVAEGWTFRLLTRILSDWADHEGVPWPAVARNVRIVGLTWRGKTSPNTLRWHQEIQFHLDRRPAVIKNVSIPGRLFAYLASDAPKTSRSFHPGRWGDDEVTLPTRDDEARQALAFAVHLFDLGRNADMRRRFARALADQPAMTESWFRSLILELKR